MVWKNKYNKHPRDPNNINTIYITRTTVVTTLNRLNVAQAMTSAHRLLGLKGSKNYTYDRMEYQRLILEYNEGGIKQRNEKSMWKKPYYTVYNGVPCIHCKLLIPLGSRVVRRRAGVSSKYLHVVCYERLYKTNIPLQSEPEQAAMRLGLYPSMHIPITK